MQRSLLIVALLSAGCVSRLDFTIVESHFSFPNSNVTPIGEAQSRKTKACLPIFARTPNANDLDDLMLSAMKSSGGDSLTDIYVEVNSSVMSCEYILTATANKVTVGRQFLDGVGETGAGSGDSVQTCPPAPPAAVCPACPLANGMCPACPVCAELPVAAVAAPVAPPVVAASAVTSDPGNWTTVRVRGEASDVALIGHIGTFSVPGKVPPGVYGIRANFGRTQIRAGQVAVQEGDPAVELHCAQAFSTCTAQ